MQIAGDGRLALDDGGRRGDRDLGRPDRNVRSVGLLRRRRGVDLAFELLELALQNLNLRLQLIDLIGADRLRIGRTGREDCRQARGAS